MPVQLIEEAPQILEAKSLGEIAAPERRMYAIAFDMDIESLRKTYGEPYNKAYFEIRKVLKKHGFRWQQGSVYFGGEEINAVTCVLAAMDLARSLPWFAESVRDIRLLRIEELNDLMPAIRDALQEDETQPGRSGSRLTLVPPRQAGACPTMVWNALSQGARK